MRNVLGFGARTYDVLTSSAPWRAQAGGLLEHAANPSGIRFVRDLGCSQAVGRIDAAWIAERFREAGFSEVGTAPTLGGLGLHCFGRA